MPPGVYVLSRTQMRCGVAQHDRSGVCRVLAARAFAFLSHKLSILRSASRAVGATLCMLSTSLASARAAAPSSPLPQRAAWPREVEGEVRGRREPPLRTHTSTHRVVGPPGQHTDRQPAFSPLPRAGALFSRLGHARPSRSSEDGWLQSSATSMLLAARLLASQDRAVCLPRTTDW